MSECTHPLSPILRFGILGAARIAPAALIAPARRVAGVRVDAVAARELQRAQEFARRHALPRAYGSYSVLLGDPELDAVYVALPNAWHAEWALAALEAGKHVLCEKPLTSNAVEAEGLAAAAQIASTRGLLLAEAFHNRYHPLVQRIEAVVRSGELGTIRAMRAVFRTPMLRREDIRYHYALGGGAMMDLGCYMVNLVRFVAGEDPTVESARAEILAPAVDKRMAARLRLAGGAAVEIDVELRARTLPAVYLRVDGELGSLTAVNPVLPQLYHHLRVRSPAGARTERFARVSTYDLQLAAFVAAVQQGTTLPTDAADAVRTMHIIDACYLAAGLQPRGTSA